MAYDEYINRNSWKAGQPVSQWLAKRTLNEILRLTKINPSATAVLEIGSGFGYFAECVESTNFNSYTAFEPNSKLANLTRSKTKNGKVYELALPSIPVGFSNSFDVVVCIHVIEHAPNGYEALSWITSVKTLLKDGGQLIIISPSISDYKSYFWEIDWSHCFPTSNNNLRQILLDLDFKISNERIFRLGSTRRPLTTMAKLLDCLIPTRVLNTFGNLMIGRPLGTGLKAAFIWGSTFMVAVK
jgi:SAM-dependent methyltransferase